MNYDKFKKNCFEKLNLKQEIFYKKYNINSYPKWFYDQPAGILTFSNGEDELNFRYYQVGTFSKTTNTWLWSWDKEDTPKKMKNKLEEVKEFGIKHGFDELTKAYFESSKNIGWEFSSIACELLNGLAAYRPETENLFIFMIIYEVLDNEKANEEKNKFVDCEKHERARRAFVCEHLISNSEIGFVESFETFEDMEFKSDDDDIEAWCDKCESIRLEHNGWNDESIKLIKIKLICEKCYFEIKSMNTKK